MTGPKGPHKNFKFSAGIASNYIFWRRGYYIAFICITVIPYHFYQCCKYTTKWCVFFKGNGSTKVSIFARFIRDLFGIPMLFLMYFYIGPTFRSIILLTSELAIIKLDFINLDRYFKNHCTNLSAEDKLIWVK